jgi:HPt (histidine-containing phosphotransfer) domain-containing protein
VTAGQEGNDRASAPPTAGETGHDIGEAQLHRSDQISAVGSSEQTADTYDPGDQEVLELLPVLDTRVLRALQQLGSGEDLVGELSNLLLVEADASLVAIRQAIGAADHGGVARSAHSLRGASANLGATRLASACEILEQTSLEGGPQNVEPLWAGLRSLEAEVALVRSAFVAPNPTP